MNLKTTILYPDDPDTSWVAADVAKFVERGYILYRALFQQSRAVISPTHYEGRQATSEDVTNVKDYFHDVPTYIGER